MSTGYPTKSAHIRALGLQGMSVADISRAVGVQYQHARKVLLDAGLLVTAKRPNAPTSVAKPALARQALLSAGFVSVGYWRNVAGELVLDGELPKAAGVYAFCDGEKAVYVGVATMGLAKRIYFYRKPGRTQTTSIRVKAALLAHLQSGVMEVLVAEAGVSEWNGLPVDLNAGLELGLIKQFSIAWNKRGT